jgi:hypothetical protein
MMTIIYAGHREMPVGNRIAERWSGASPPGSIVVESGTRDCSAARLSGKQRSLHSLHLHHRFIHHPPRKASTMTRSTLALALATGLSLGAIAAHAESPDPSGQYAHTTTSGKTHAQVQAELQEALRNGDVAGAGESVLTDFEARPWAHAPRTAVAGKTREQVRAETLDAIRSGDILQAGESGLSRRQLSPQTYYARERGEQQRTAGAQQAASPLTP